MPRYAPAELQCIRCLTLLFAMARAHRGVSLRQFAERHGWKLRTVHRDRDTLRAVGVPVEEVERARYRVASNWLPPAAANVNGEDLVALALARQLAPGLADTFIGQGLARLFSQLASPNRQQTLPLSDDAWLQARAGVIDYGPHRRTIDGLREALRARRAVAIRYRTPDGTLSERVIEPVCVRWEPTAEALYVFAWCRLREAFRTFAVHRVLATTVLSESVAARPAAIRELAKAYRLWARPKVEHVSLRFAARVALEVHERCWHTSQRVTDAPDGGVIVEMDIGAPEELVRILLGYGPDVVVEAPASLAAAVHDGHAAAVRMGTILVRTEPEAAAARAKMDSH